MAFFWKNSRLIVLLLLSAALAACVAEQSEDSVGSLPLQVTTGSAVPPTPSPTAPIPASQVQSKPTPNEASRFLMAATFGPNSQSIEELVDQGYSDWYLNQLEMPMLSIVEATWPYLSERTQSRGEHDAPIATFYDFAILGSDQLRLRAAYSLSQILVVSHVSNNVIASDGEGLARYMDILQEGAFGNFRDLLEEVTYSPIMGEYLTYAGNRKGDLETGTAPDENFAREIMQLFTIGLYELNLDGTLRLDENGDPIETYTNEDITELSKVFTGLWWEGLPFDENRNDRSQLSSIRRMVMHEQHNSKGSKTILGETIPSSLDGNESIQAALDILFEHPNTAPFISHQLIQRLTTSNPSPAYVARVAQAFNSGRYELPNQSVVGSGIRGDLRAVWAAVLFDEEFHASHGVNSSDFGKLREPVLRLTHWARMAGVARVDLHQGTDNFVLWHHDRLGQRAFSSPTVFNFYRPGYIAPGLETSEAGLVAPELQITNQSSIVSYANFMRRIVFRDGQQEEAAAESGVYGSYTGAIELADDALALTDLLDLELMAGRMSRDTRRRIALAVEDIPLNGESDIEQRKRRRVMVATLIAVVSPEFLVQR